jgi:hypothetical protein
MRVNESHNGELSGKQQRAIEALLSEPTTKAAAEKAKVSEATLHRWLNDPAFSVAHKEARGRLLETTLTALQSASVEAVACLRNVVNDKGAPTTARVSAARNVLDFALKAHDVLEVEERLMVLEARLDAQAESKGKT